MRVLTPERGALPEQNYQYHPLAFPRRAVYRRASLIIGAYERGVKSSALPRTM